MPSNKDLRLLFKQERALKMSLDNVKEFVKSYRGGGDKSSLKLRMEKLDELLKNFLDVRMNIELLIDDVENDAEAESGESEEARDERLRAAQTKRDQEDRKLYLDFENEVYALKETLMGFLQASSSTGSGTGQQPQPTVITQSRVKLPELKLPSFGGKMSEWVTFRDTYKNLIHNDERLSDMDKFTYLRTTLTGDALQEIASIEMSSANYDIAWSALETLYENKKLLVMTHLDSLFALEPLRQENFESLNRLVNGFEKSLQMLSKIGENTEGWSTLLQYMLCKRLHPTTLRQWESHYKSKEVPKYKDLIEFLKSHCSVLQSITPGRQFQSDPKKFSRPTTSHAGIQSPGVCPFCGEGAHSAFKCAKFSRMRVAERVDAVKKSYLCLNCFSPAHIARFCTRGSCQLCGQRHHSLLHANSSTTANAQSKPGTPQGSQVKKTPPQNLQPPQNQARPTPNGHSTHTQQTQKPNTEAQSNCATNASTAQSHNPATDCVSYHTAPSVHTQHVPHTVLLSTAVVSIADQYGNSTLARALLDSGSQRCYMSEHLSQTLKFKRSREYLPITGIGGSRAASTQAVFAEVRSLATTYARLMKFHVLPRVTVDLPVRSIDISAWSLPNELVLADPTFHESGAVDLIIGAEIFLQLIVQDRHITLGNSGPTLQNTQLGWTVSGTVPDESTCYSVVDSEPSERIEEQLSQFFELESCRTTSILSLEESACESHFEETTTRDQDGKFIVSLPKKQFMIDHLGESRAIAVRRFLALERKLNANPTLKKMYSGFIEEYHRLRHMREVPPEAENPSKIPYYLPHHAVLRPDSTTTKLRVVFDASCASETGVSLNDTLMVGPVVQEDLYSIILRFRLRKYALTADIEKMYRMVKVHPEDYHLQRILWRDTPTEPLRTFELTTVTYGTSPAPYLATRCLKKLADEYQVNFPEAADTIRYEFYVDDLLKSVDSIVEGELLCIDLIHVLGKAGLTLRKWSSNSREIMDRIPPFLRDERMALDLEPSSTTIKTLGLKWEPRSDMFRFAVPQWNPATELTKRIILSDFAKLFDPLGLVGPVIVQAKIFLQDLWRIKCSWNDVVSEELRDWWLEFRNSLSALTRLEVPRWVAFGKDILSAELHTFCDASEKAYGACVYLRCTSFDGTVTVSLLTAKSRVAPLEDLEKKRKRTTIPRLELSSALTAAHLYEKVVQSLEISAQSYFWTDSMIVKCWLSSPPGRWNVFVANRVSEIQHTTRGGIWNHIAGSENPADVLSRGMVPEQLESHQTWWQGPPWLRLDKESWPRTAKLQVEDLDPSLLEEKSVVSVPAQVVEHNPIFSLKSKLHDLLRSVAYLRRFAHNCRHPQDRQSGPLTFQELEDTQLHLVALAQQESFPEDFAELKKNGAVRPTSRLKALNPQLVSGLLLVGGRLAHANVSVGRKHPIILDNRHPFTEVIATHYHDKLLHAGQTLLISSMRERYWPIAAQSVARKVIHRCMKCFRTRPKAHEQIMADLPVERVTPAPPFLRVGVDFCGPFTIKYPLRFSRPVKCFIAVFVCLVVKAVHLEVVTDLSTQAFIAALRRFVAQRGVPEVIFCDNATNFVGADRELRRLFRSQNFKQAVVQEAASGSISFRFIPPRSPNFGGLWEAAVKSLKGHLKRTLGNTILFSDEFATLVAQIGACLHSRPLTPLSNDPNDLDILTPGHFLVHRSLTAIPEPSLQDLNQNRLSKWQTVQDFLQKIWHRWSTSYLSNLHGRTKWTRQRNNLFEGTMVLLREDNVPPLQWHIGRVIEVHTGNDGNIRVVKVRTQDGEYLRAISKVCILPIRDNEDPASSAQGED